MSEDVQPRERSKAGTCLVLAILLVAACGKRWRPAGDDPNRQFVFRGTVTSVRSTDDGVTTIGLETDVGCRSALPDGQVTVACDLLPGTQWRFKKVLGELKQGRPVEISGYGVIDTRSGETRVRPVTSIDIWPDKGP